jgi:hypothetical protein
MKIIKAKKINRKNLLNFLQQLSHSLNHFENRKKMQSKKSVDNDWNWHYSY